MANPPKIGCASMRTLKTVRGTTYTTLGRVDSVGCACRLCLSFSRGAEAVQIVEAQPITTYSTKTIFTENKIKRSLFFTLQVYIEIGCAGCDRLCLYANFPEVDRRHNLKNRPCLYHNPKKQVVPLSQPTGTTYSAISAENLCKPIVAGLTCTINSRQTARKNNNGY